MNIIINSLLALLCIIAGGAFLGYFATYLLLSVESNAEKAGQYFIWK